MIYASSISSNPFAVSLGSTSYSGGLSAESVEIAGQEGTTDLFRNTNGSAREVGGLSAESVEIAGGEEGTTDLVRNTNGSNQTT